MASPLSLDDALALLEVDVQATAKQLKRAYLRKTKVFKPERDPEGFQRLREAYELAVSRAVPKRATTGSGAGSSTAAAAVSDGRPDRGAPDRPATLPSIEMRVGEDPWPLALELLASVNDSDAATEGLREAVVRITTAPTPHLEMRVLAQAALELTAPDSVVPRRFAEPMARVLMEGDDAAEASTTLRDLAKEHPFATAELLDAIRGGAPAVAMFFADDLRDASELESTSILEQNASWNSVLWLVVGVLVVLLRCASD